MPKQPAKPSLDYTVGYRKPPVATQFKPGQSGNRKGRPPGRLNMLTVVNRIMREPITVIEKGVSKKITRLEAATKQQANKAAAGDLQSFRTLLPLLMDTEQAALSVDVDRNEQAVMATLIKRFAAPTTEPNPKSEKTAQGHVEGSA